MGKAGLGLEAATQERMAAGRHRAHLGTNQGRRGHYFTKMEAEGMEYLLTSWNAAVVENTNHWSGISQYEAPRDPPPTAPEEGVCSK